MNWLIKINQLQELIEHITSEYGFKYLNVDDIIPTTAGPLIN